MRRRMLASLGGAKLPYDAEVEYLQNSSSLTEYIELPVDVYIGSNPVMEADFRYISLKDSNIIGSPNNAIRINHSKTTAYIYYLTTRFSGTVPTVEYYHKWEYSIGRLRCDGVVVLAYKSLSQTLTCDRIWLFKANHNSIAQAEIHGFKLTLGGVLVYDLIPVRKDGIGFMYDKVSGQLFGNKGTGAFIIGPDK